MSNDAKLGLLAGVMVVVVVAVFFYPQAGAGPAAIPGAPTTAPAAAAPSPPPAKAPTVAGPTTAPTSDGIWKFSEPRVQKPVSTDPLLWPRN